MLKAYISGQAGVAVQVLGDTLLCRTAFAREVNRRPVRDFDFLFAGITDLRVVECRSDGDIHEKLNLATFQDDTLASMMVLLDPGGDPSARELAAAEVEIGLQVPSVSRFLWQRFYACVLPVPISLPRDIHGQCREFFDRLLRLQPRIQIVHMVWDSLPDDCFKGLPSRAQMMAQFRDLGVLETIILPASVEWVPPAQIEPPQAIQLFKEWVSRVSVLAALIATQDPLIPQPVQAVLKRIQSDRPSSFNW